MVNLSFSEKFREYATEDSFELIGRINEELRNLNFFALLVIYWFVCDWQEDCFCSWVDRVASKVDKAYKVDSDPV